MNPSSKGGRRLLFKYVVSMGGIVCAASLAIGLVAIWISYHQHKAALIQIQHEQAEAAAAKISQFVKEIERQLGWMVQVPWSSTTLNERRIDALRLLRQVPAMTELTMLDNSGHEQLRVSRLTVDTVGSGIDRSDEPIFRETIANHVFYGPVYLHRESEPYMTLALSGPRSDAGVGVASVNLKFIWDVVSQIKVGTNGLAYVVNAEGRLIAHPDISLVLRNTDFSQLPQVQAARRGVNAFIAASDAKDTLGRPVLAMHAAIAPLGWIVFVERPAEEAFAPAYASLLAIGAILAVALAIAIVASVILARRMVTPIRVLQHGAARIGAGALDHRIDIRTGDELQVLGEQFNNMAAQLQDSYANLERKVEQRTHQLELANLAKSRFLAAASHDLRQPLHALGLFVSQLRSAKGKTEREHVVGRVDAAVSAMNDLFNALLDISKLDAGALSPDIADFPIRRLFERLETTFAEAAHEKGLRLRVVRSTAWVRSDPILLERILLNLASNAVRYTEHGGIVIGCRHQGELLRIQVWDSGVGIPADQQRNVFNEFYRLNKEERHRGSGLGLGLAIVDRLSGLLGHPIELASHVGKGSCFTVSVPVAPARLETRPAPAASIDPVRGKLIAVIDDDVLVLDAMRGMLQSWGCRTVTEDSGAAALVALKAQDRPPDLIISDFRLADGKSGVSVIEHLRDAFHASIPAFLMTGDTSSERLREATVSGYHLLHKPVQPMTLRAMLSQLLRERTAAPARDRSIAATGS